MGGIRVNMLKSVLQASVLLSLSLLSLSLLSLSLLYLSSKKKKKKFLVTLEKILGFTVNLGWIGLLENKYIFRPKYFVCSCQSGNLTISMTIIYPNSRILYAVNSRIDDINIE